MHRCSICEGFLDVEDVKGICPLCESDLEDQNRRYHEAESCIYDDVPFDKYIKK